MQGEKNLRSRFVEKAVFLAVFLSNISQLPFFVRSGMTQRIAFPGWILLLLMIFFTRRIHLSKSVLNIINIALAFVIWCAFLTVITENEYLTSSLAYSFFISLFVLILGNIAADHLSNKSVRTIMTLYMATTIILTLVIFFEYFGFGYRLTSKLYAYSSKNSVSQIIFSAIIVLMVYFKPGKPVLQIVRIVVIVFELYVLLLLRSRATLVGLILCNIIMAFSKNIKRRTKIAILLIGSVTIIVLFASSRFYDFVFNTILFAGRNAEDLNELTSGRLAMIQSFPEMISNHWFEGIGSIYYESFPLSSILQFGLLGGLLLIGISLTPMINSAKYRRISDESAVLFYIAIGYTVNGLFEGLTPFGPGIKCYFLWLLFGILLKWNSIDAKGKGNGTQPVLGRTYY